MKKVFLVDDDVFLTKLYTTLLQNEGIQVAATNSGEDAMAQLPGFNPDLVVLDLHMPGITGAEVFRFIRNRMESRRLPVIVFSNGYIQALVAEVGDLQAQKVLSKLSCKPKQLVLEIKSLLEGLPDVAIEEDPQSALEAATMHAPEEAIDQLSTWLNRLHEDSRLHARRVCLIHIYKIMRTTIQRAMTADATTPRGKLSRALKNILDDLFDHPEHVTESTMEVLSHSFQKLLDLGAKTCDSKLESETALMDLLLNLDD